MIYSAHCAPHKFTVYKSCKFVIITEKGGNNTKNINVNVHRPPANIPLGRQGENLATCVIFDCSGFAQLYGDGTAELLHELKSGTVYPVAIKQDGTSVSWIVTASDTATIGSGRAELRWYVGDTLAKSAKFRTSVSSALADSTTETPPEPQKSWVDKVLKAAQEIKDGAISDDKLAAAIAAYLEEHPIDTGLDEAALATYLTENGYLTDAALADAIAQALAEAKASGEFDGAPGEAGADGSPGADGADGVGIESVVQTTTSTEDGGTNIVTVTKTDGTTSTFQVKNGSKGSDGVPGKDGANGADGQPGTDGVTPNIQIGTVETLEAGSPATASMTGTPENPLLNLGIPKGADGASGSGGSGETTENLPIIQQFTISGDETNTIEFTDLNNLTEFELVLEWTWSTTSGDSSIGVWLQPGFVSYRDNCLNISKGLKRGVTAKFILFGKRISNTIQNICIMGGGVDVSNNLNHPCVISAKTEIDYIGIRVATSGVYFVGGTTVTLRGR